MEESLKTMNEWLYILPWHNSDNEINAIREAGYSPILSFQAPLFDVVANLYATNVVSVAIIKAIRPVEVITIMVSDRNFSQR